MTFIIELNRELANIVGQKKIEVAQDPLNGEVIQVGPYRTHLSNVLYVKEI